MPISPRRPYGMSPAKSSNAPWIAAAAPAAPRVELLLAAYEVLLTPDFEPFPAERMLTEPYAGGLFELVACSRQCWESR